MRSIWKWASIWGLLAVCFGLLTGCYLLTAPPAPENLSASDGEHPEAVAVSWSSAPRASRYEVFRATEEDGEYAKIGDSTITNFSDTTAQGNVLYWYRVRACNSFGCSPFSQADSGHWLGPLPPRPPRNVQASDGTFPNYIRITWSPSLAASSYEVFRSDVRDADYFLIGRASTPSYQDLEIVPGRTYWYKVRACNAHGCSEFSGPDSGLAALQPPGVPENVQASDGAYNDRVRVTWTASAGAATYEVHRATSEGGTYTLRGTATGTSYDDTGVPQGTTYWYRVRACNAAGCSAFSVPDSGFSSAGGGGGGGTPALPGQPQNVAASDGAFPDKIRVTWSGVAGATRYEIWRADTDTGASSQIGETTGTSYEDTTPGMCVEKWYKVRACNAAGCGPFSVPDSGYRGASLKNVDGTKLKATVIWTSGTTAVVELEWVHIEKNVEYDVYYEIWRRSPGTTLAKLAEETSNTYTDTTVVLGTTYYYKVRACSTQTCIPCSAFTGEVQAVVACNPAPPSGAINASYAAGQVTVTWTAVAGATKYQVFRSTSAGGAYDYVGETTSTTFSHSSGPGTYYYKVKTCVACGCGGLSAASNAVTVP